MCRPLGVWRGASYIRAWKRQASHVSKGLNWHGAPLLWREMLHSREMATTSAVW